MKTCMIIKSRQSVPVLIMFLVCCLMVTDTLAAQAGQIMLNGRVKSIDLTSNIVVVTDYGGKDFRLSIEDQKILEKFRDGRIKVDDDVNVKYIIKDDKNIPFSLRKLSGC